MASIRCAHCTETHSSVQEVRQCATATVPALAAAGQSRNGVAPGHEAFAHAAMNQYANPTSHHDGHPQTWPFDRPVPADPITNGAWGTVNELRQQIKAHLVREERGKHIGYFALLEADGVKFYRVRSPLKGKWAGYVFIDAQASDEFWPVRTREMTKFVLEGILADPEAAGLLYATELGRCYRCRRTLTDETSRERGIGPECYRKGL